MAALEAEYEVLKPWEATDPAAFIKEHGPPGARRRQFRPSPRLPHRRVALSAKLEALACFGPPRHHFRCQAGACARHYRTSSTPDETAEPVADLAPRADRRHHAPPVRGRPFRARLALADASLSVRARSAQAALRHQSGLLAHRPAGRQAGSGGRRWKSATRARAPNQSFPTSTNPAWWNWRAGAIALVVTCALTPETRGMVNATVPDALGPESFWSTWRAAPSSMKPP